MKGDQEAYVPDWRHGLQHAEAAPRCGAKRRDGGVCRQPGMANGRCRLHGGKSTGPRTAEGLERCRRAPWKTGRYSAERKELRRQIAAAARELRATVCEARRFIEGDGSGD